MKTDLINLTGLALETLAEMANEAGEQVENHAKSAVTIAMAAGRALTAAKEQVPHGEWNNWLGKHWNYSQKTATDYMRLSNWKRASNLTDATSLREAMRMISEDPETPKRAGKASKVEVVEIEQTDSATEPQPEPSANKPPKDDDPNPAPKTNTKHSAATQRPKEADKPKPAPITPEIIDEPVEVDPVEEWIGSHSLTDVVTKATANITEPKQKKTAAKQLRKCADHLDPPTKFRPPTVDEVAEYCSGRQNKVDPESFVAHYSANGWRLSNGNKMADWQSAVITWEKNHGTKNTRGNSRGPRDQGALSGNDW